MRAGQAQMHAAVDGKPGDVAAVEYDATAIGSKLA